MELIVRSREGLHRRGGSFILWGAALVLFGVAVLAWPGLTGTVLVTLIGAVILVAGLALLYGAFRLRDVAGSLWLLALIPGLAVTIFGIVVLAFPTAVSNVLLVVIAVLVILAGLGDIIASFALATVVSWWWLRLARGVLFAGAGIWAIFSDLTGLVALGAALGVWAILLGVLSVVFGVLAMRA